MFDPVAGAYFILSKIKENYPETRDRVFNSNEGKKLLKDLSKHQQTEDTREYIKSINMKVPIVKGEDVRSRQAILSLNDVFQLLAVWQWLLDLEKDGDTDKYDEDIKYLARLLSSLIKKVDSVDTRQLSTGVSFSYFANMKNAVKFLGTYKDDDESLQSAYKTRVNLVLKYYLDLAPIFEEEDNGV